LALALNPTAPGFALGLAAQRQGLANQGFGLGVELQTQALLRDM